jgi:hypothetical protein
MDWKKSKFIGFAEPKILLKRKGVFHIAAPLKTVTEVLFA